MYEKVNRKVFRLFSSYVSLFYPYVANNRRMGLPGTGYILGEGSFSRGSRFVPGRGANFLVHSLGVVTL